MIRAVAAVVTTLTVAPGVGVAGPWEVFAERCLAPMEHFMPGRIDGLDPSSVETKVDGTLSFDIGRDGAALHVSPGPVCRLSIKHVTDVTLDAALAWRADALASGRYVEAEDGVLESNLWREPRLAVRIELDGETGDAAFTAEETDLES